MELDNTLGFILGRVSRKVHYRLDEIFKANDITIEQWVGLRMIDEEGPLCQKELADRMEKNQSPDSLNLLWQDGVLSCRDGQTACDGLDAPCAEPGPGIAQTRKKEGL